MSLKEIPSQFEQDTAEAYCLKRKLVRPDTNVKTVLKWFLCFEGLAIMLSFAFYVLFDQLGISFCFLSQKLFFVRLYLSVSIVTSVLFLRKMLILLIELYQHYAPENVRRRCIFMPTCSEYAILALRKYGVIIGSYKTYIRLTKKCCGHIYRIDYP